MAAVFLI